MDINIIFQMAQEIVINIGYLGILLFMTIESSFIPFPSEIIMIPAGYMAYLGDFNIFLVIITGTIGSLIGALINYYIAQKIGTQLHIRKYKLINNKHIKKAECFFNKYGESTIFWGRLIPVIRQYISIPAGFVKMDITKFVLWTSLGALVWCSILAVIGYSIGNIIFDSSIYNWIGIILLISFTIIISLKYKKIKC